LLKNHDVYDESKFEAAKLMQEASRITRIKADARKLGFDLVHLTETACSGSQV